MFNIIERGIYISDVECPSNNIYLKVIDLPTTMMDLPDGQEWVFDTVNNILIEVLGTIAEQKRQTIRKRQKEGIDAAKQKGKHLGRPKMILPENYDDIMSKWQNKEITVWQAMDFLGISKTSFCRKFIITQ